MTPNWQQDTGSFVDSPVVPLGDGGLILAATWGGETAVIWVGPSTVNPAAVLPKLTAVAPVRFVPVMVTNVPPTSGPLVGLIAVTVGAATKV